MHCKPFAALYRGGATVPGTAICLDRPEGPCPPPDQSRAVAAPGRPRLAPPAHRAGSPNRRHGTRWRHLIALSGASWEPDPLTEGSDQRRLVDELNRVARQNRTPLDKDARSLRRSG